MFSHCFKYLFTLLFGDIKQCNFPTFYVSIVFCLFIYSELDSSGSVKKLTKRVLKRKYGELKLHNYIV